MRWAVLSTIWIVFTVHAAHAQGAGAATVFEVASVKPGAAPTPQVSADGRATAMRSGCMGGPGTQDPGRYTCQNATLSSIVASAYELKRYQYSFPSWMNAAYFDITAKVPAGTTKEQFRLMKQNLLAERFKLAAHFEQKETQVYELVVGKDGAKLQESQPEAESAKDAPPTELSKLKRDSEGIPILPRRPGSVSMLMMSGGPSGSLMRMQASDQTMEQLASLLSNQVGKPVTDATGIKGKYDITITCSPDSMGSLPVPPPPGAAAPGETPPSAMPADTRPTIFAAIQQQLGLKLEPKKGAVDFLVIDHVEKTPVEN